MDAILTIVTRVGYCAVAPIGSKIRYLQDYHENLRDLRDQFEKLNDAKDDVQRLVNAAIRNGNQIKVTVIRWLGAVEEIIEVVEPINAEFDSNKRCLKGLCPNWLSRYKLSEMAFKKTLIVTELLGRKPNEEVSIPLPPLNIGILSDLSQAGRRTGDVLIHSEPHRSDVSAGATSSGSSAGDVLAHSKLDTSIITAVASTSSISKNIVLQKKTVDEIIDQQRGTVEQVIFYQREAVNQIFDALQDENCDTVGIYGMGGIGKTTLAKEIGKMAKTCCLFDDVVFAVVSQNLDIRKVQGQIGDILGLRFFEESDMGRAGRLYERLTTQRILLILDDVWASVNLNEIGVPCYDGKKGCKILITTRQRSNWNIMGFQKTKKIPLRLLSEEESWELLKSNAGLMADLVSLQHSAVAMEVARECGGLPLATVTVGKALQDKDLDDWKAALQQLRKSKTLNMNNIEKDVFSCLKLSYDNLKSEEAKECFLLCCLFPEDHDIKIDDIARFGVGKGLFSDVVTMQESRRDVRWIVRSLTDSCLLIDNGDKDCVRMHDVVRDFAISIASEKNYGFLVKSGLGLKEWPNRETIKHNVIISLMANRIQSLPAGLNCPRLEMLLLGENEGFQEISDTFFEGMKELRVLDLSERIGIQDLNDSFGTFSGSLELFHSFKFPSSFVSLENLRTLYLDHCKLDDIAILGKLKSLEILSLYGCYIKELPNEIGELVNLKLLDLNFCRNLEIVPAKLISRLRRLEELYMGESFKQWAAEAEELVEDRSKACLSEIKSLSHLTTLCVQVSNPQSVPRNLHIANLQNFEIIVGAGYNSVTCYPTSKSLYLREIKTSRPEGLKCILQNTEELMIFCSSDELVREILDGDHGNLNSLKYLKVDTFMGLSLIRKRAHDAPVMLAALEKLHFRLIDNIFCICRYSLPLGSLQKLKILKVENCLHLQTIVTAALLERLLSLEEVEVEWCNQVDRIFECHGIAAEKEHFFLSNLRIISLKFLSKLQSIWSGLHPIFPSVNLSKLTVVEISECRHLRSLFPCSIAQNLQQLKVLKIQWCCELESLVAEFPGVSINDDQRICFPSLETIELEACRFKSLFSVAEARNLLRLKEIKVSNCNEFTELISHKNNGGERNEDTTVLLPSLNSIEIKDMPNIARLCAMPFFIDLPSLERMILVKCPKMENLAADASKYGLGNAPKLKRAQIGEHAFGGTASGLAIL